MFGYSKHIEHAEHVRWFEHRQHTRRFEDAMRRASHGEAIRPVAMRRANRVLKTRSMFHVSEPNNMSGSPKFRDTDPMYPFRYHIFL